MFTFLGYENRDDKISVCEHQHKTLTMLSPTAENVS
jgi:hypothetical protein